MRYVIAIILLLAVSMVSPIRSWLNVNEGAVGGILTFMLVIMYFGLYNLQNKQLELENRSMVDIEEYDEDGSDLHLLLSNHGNGVATNLEIETQIEFLELANIEPEIQSYHLRKVGDEGDRKSRVGNTLKAGQQNVWFVESPKMALKMDGETQGYGLGAGCRRLARAGVEEVLFQFFVKNTDPLGNEYSQSVYGILPYTVDLSETIPNNIEEVVAYGQTEW